MEKCVLYFKNNYDHYFQYDIIILVIQDEKNGINNFSTHYSRSW